MNLAQSINPRTRMIVTVILLVSAFICLCSQTMIVTALPLIQKIFGVSMNTAQWLTTGYTLIIGIVTPLSSNLYDKYSNRRFFLTTVGVFIIGTLIGCLATNFATLLIARLVQAAAGGMMMTFQMTTMISIYPAEKRGSILGLSSLVVATGPALGPTIAGFILQVLSWRYLFILVLPFMILAWVIGFFILPNYSQPRDIKIDLLSVAISLFGSSLTLGSITVISAHWLAGLIMLVVGLAVLYAFVRRQLKLENPMLKVQIFKKPSFRLMTIVTICIFMILLGTEQMMPIFSENVLGDSTFVAGLILLPGALCNGITASIVGPLSDRFGAKWLVLSGATLVLLTSIPLVMLQKNTSEWLLAIDYTFRMIGVGMVFSPSLSEAFSELSTLENSHGTALNNTLRQCFGAVSVTLLVVISNIPSSLITGVRASMWTTIVMNIILLFTFIYYLRRYKHAA